jgi:Protein of unknown function (DUF3618)
MTAGETGNSGSGHAPPDDPEALLAEIDRTRQELGDTVEALAAKADVKARAQQRAAEVSGQLKDRLTGLRLQLAGRAGQLKGDLTGKAAGGRQAVTNGGKTVLGAGQPAARRLSQRGAQAGTAAWAATPEPVQRRAKQVARTVDQHRGPAIAIAGATAVVAGWLAIRWLRR